MNRITQTLFFVLTLLSTNVKSQLDWFQQSVPISSDLYDIEFVNLNVGYAVGVSGRILKTTNGGYTWLEQTSGTTADLFDCEFETELIGWVCGGSGLVLRTINGGETWTPKTILTNDEFHAIHFYSATSGFVAGKNTSTGLAEIYYTLDGGVTFNGISPPPGMSDIKDIVFANLNTGLIMDNWSVYYTTSGGLSWATSSYSTSFAVNRIEMFSATSGWMVGDEGTIFFSNTGGVTWTPQTSPVIAPIYGLSIVDASNVFACGQGGLIISTSNGGLTWDQHTPIVTTALKSISAVDTANVWAAGIGPKIVRSQTPLDLEVHSYAGPSTVCAGLPFQVSVNIKNSGSYTIDAGNFTVLDGINTILSYDLTTPLLAGQTLTLDLGLHTIYANTIITINFTGDDVTDNNVALAPINLYTSDQHGITGPATACIGEMVALQAFGGSEYYWLNAGTDSTAQNQTILFTESTAYVVEITQLNCVFVDTLKVEVGAGDCATSAFSPNADGKNDFFFIDNLPIGENSVTIFNRWGDPLITIQNYDNVTVYWNGDDSFLKPLHEGVYFYVVESKTTGPYSEGWVSLVR